MPPRGKPPIVLAPAGWKVALQELLFMKRAVTGLLAILLLLAIFPHFFQIIEKRHGIVLNDPLLRWIPPVNVSVPIFILLWGLFLLFFYRVARNPQLILLFAYSYVVLCLMRIITISLVPLNPPPGLIPLADPISNVCYGHKFITKDLFFSGHTSTMFLLYLCLEKSRDKLIGLIVTLLIGTLVLVQHVHYTCDVIAAPFFTYWCFVIGRRLALRIPE